MQFCLMIIYCTHRQTPSNKTKASFPLIASSQRVLSNFGIGFQILESSRSELAGCILPMSRKEFGLRR